MNIWARWIEQDGRFLFSLNDNGGHEISRDRHMELLDACAAGQILRPGDGGVPELADPLPPSIEMLSDQERTWRTTELNHYEWMVTRHRDEQEMGGALSLASEQFSELLAYRKRLRDWPSVDAFPGKKSRPAAPDWLLTIKQ